MRRDAARGQLVPVGLQRAWFSNLSKWAYNVDVEQTIPLPQWRLPRAPPTIATRASADTVLLFTAGSRAAANTYLDASIQYRAASRNWNVTAFVNNLINKQPVVRAQGTGATETASSTLPMWVRREPMDCGPTSVSRSTY